VPFLNTSLFLLLRSKPVGIDRFCNKIWWFDGTGSMSALSTVPFDTTAMTTTTADDGTESASSASYGTGRLYIQGSTAEERRRLGIKFGVPEEEIAERRKKEEGEEGLLEEGEWGVYDEPDKVRFARAFISSSRSCVCTWMGWKLIARLSFSF
jgi:bromodomain adjacent to zinc finger domain protein 1A